MELIDVYDENGNKTGKVVDRNTKDEIFEKGEHIGVSSIYIEDDNNEFLIQKTSIQKGNIYSMTAGHINHNETPKEAIIREAKEELDIDISKEEIIDLGYIIVDFPVRFIFYLKKNINIDDITLKKDEVEEVSYKTLNEIKQIINEGNMHKVHLEIIKLIEKYKEGILDEQRGKCNK